MGRQTVTYDKSTKLKANRFKKSGYVLKGWNTKKNGKGKSYANQKTVKNLTSINGKTINLYAQWKKVSKPDIVKKVSAASKKAKTCTLTITNVKKADGYQIRYASDKAFKKTKTVYVSEGKGKKTSTVIKGLKRKKTYYVKVRAYIKDSAGKRYYSKNYSSVKSVKIR